MPRPLWKGHISFGLVHIPVTLHAATKSNDLRFKLLDSRNMGKVRYQRINEETGSEVPWESIVKGYEYDKGNYVLLTDEDFNKVAGESSKTIDITEFIPRHEMDCIYFETPYYLLPQGKGSDKGYVLLRETLRESETVGIANVAIRSRQHIAVVMPYGDALLVNLLRYPQELRKTEEFEFPDKKIDSYKISKKEIDIALQLVNAMTVHWQPENYHDEYRETLMQWIEEKAAAGPQGPKKKGRKPSERMKQTKVIDFMELLKKSVQEKEKPKFRKKTVVDEPVKRKKRQK